MVEGGGWEEETKKKLLEVLRIMPISERNSMALVKVSVANVEIEDIDSYGSPTKVINQSSA